MNNVNNSMSKQTFFDLHICGVGYLNRVREVRPTKGNAYLSCSIAALRGSADTVEKTIFDCTLVGEEASRVIRHFQAASQDHKVLIGFKLGDPWVDQFTYGEGSPKAGQTGAVIKARLLLVDWVKVDGEKVWSRAPTEAQEGIAEDTAVGISEASALTSDAATSSAMPCSELGTLLG